MWSLDNWKTAFATIGLIGVLLFSLPSVGLFVRAPAGEVFSELYVLGPMHMAEGYPFNVSAGKDYLVYLGVQNHLGRVAYYQVLVKLRNSSEILPNSTAGVASPLASLYSYRVFLAGEQVWETGLNFSFLDVAFAENISSVGRIGVNNVWINVNKTASWNSEPDGYFYELFMELWKYDTADNVFVFDGRYVAFWLNMTLTT